MLSAIFETTSQNNEIKNIETFTVTIQNPILAYNGVIATDLSFVCAFYLMFTSGIGRRLS
jgi:hypothetical protein